MKQMNFVFRLGTHPPKISHYVYANIPKSKKNLKSQTLLVLRILDEGYCNGQLSVIMTEY
jgi:hypothetical protein